MGEGTVAGLGDSAVASIQAVGPEMLAVGGAIIALAAIALAISWIKATFF